jgi:hypothetical protein
MGSHDYRQKQQFSYKPSRWWIISIFQNHFFNSPECLAIVGRFPLLMVALGERNVDLIIVSNSNYILFNLEILYL